MTGNDRNKIKEKDWLVTKDQIIEVLHNTGGYLNEAAIKLGISRITLWRYISSSESLKEEVDQVKEIEIDLMESQLKKNYTSGKETSLIYAMNCKARHRGYGNFKQIEIIDKDNKPELLDPAFL